MYSSTGRDNCAHMAEVSVTLTLPSQIHTSARSAPDVTGRKTRSVSSERGLSARGVSGPDDVRPLDFPCLALVPLGPERDLVGSEIVEVVDRGFRASTPGQATWKNAWRFSVFENVDRAGPGFPRHGRREHRPLAVFRQHVKR